MSASAPPNARHWIALLLVMAGFAYGYWSWNRQHRWSQKPFALTLAQEVGPHAAPVAPGAVNDGMNQRDSALSSDRRHFLYTLNTLQGAQIFHLKRKDGPWVGPRMVGFRGGAGVRDLEPAFLPGSLELYFASNRPLPGETEPGDYNLWRTRWTDDAWAVPEPVPGVNQEGHEFYPSLAADGTLFFTSSRAGGSGGEDLWFAQPKGNGFSTPEPIPGALNTEADEFNAAVHPDGDLIAFGSAREDGFGRGDLYFSRRLADGTWGAGVLAPEPFNSPHLDFSPFFEPDSEILWFTSDRAGALAPEGMTELADLLEYWASRTSGGQDLYRIRYDRDALFHEVLEAATVAEPQESAIEPTFHPHEGVEEIAKEYFTYYLQQEYRAMLPLMAEDAVFEDPTMSLFGEPFRKEGAAEIVAWLEDVGSGVESVEFLIDHEFATGPYLVMEGTYRTTAWGTAVGLPDLHLTVEHRGITTLKVVDGKVVHHHDWIDYEEMWRQIDAAKAAQQD